MQHEGGKPRLVHRRERGLGEPPLETGGKTSRIGLHGGRRDDLFVAYARHGIGVLVYIDAHVDNAATVCRALVRHVPFLIKGFSVRILERIVSFFLPLSSTA